MNNFDSVQSKDKFSRMQGSEALFGSSVNMANPADVHSLFKGAADNNSVVSDGQMSFSNPYGSRHEDQWHGGSERNDQSATNGYTSGGMDTSMGGAPSNAGSESVANSQSSLDSGAGNSTGASDQTIASSATSNQNINAVGSNFSSFEQQLQTELTQLQQSVNQLSAMIAQDFGPGAPAPSGDTPPPPAGSGGGGNGASENVSTNTASNGASDNTTTATNSLAATNADPLIASLQSSDPTMAQALTDSAALLSPNGDASLEQYVSQNYTNPANDAQLMSQAQSQAGLSSTDATALQNVLQSDIPSALTVSPNNANAASGGDTTQSSAQAGDASAAGAASSIAANSNQSSVAPPNDSGVAVSGASTAAETTTVSSLTGAGTSGDAANSASQAVGASPEVTGVATNFINGNYGPTSASDSGVYSQGAATIDGAQNNAAIYLPAGAVETFNSDFADGGLSQFQLTDRHGDLSLPSNGEQETYNTATPGTAANPNVTVDSNGVLDLSATQTGANSYNSGAIATNQFNSNGGVTDVVAELPAGGESWPAFWQLPSNLGWPPEIDTLEALGNGQNNSGDYTPANGWLHVDTHSPTSEGSNGQWVQVKDANGNPVNLTNTYNTYESVVDPANGSNPGSISYYVDGQQVAQYSDAGSTPNQDMYMEANLAMGGSWGGDGGLGTDPNYNIASITAYAIPNPATGTMTTYNDNGNESS